MSKPLRADDPQTLGGYELVGRLGEGGMGVVYLGRTERGAPVAIKTIRGMHAGDEEFQARFRRELDATLRVGGNYVARVIDADLTAEPPYFVTEYIPGDTLEQRITRRGPMDAQELRAFAAGVAAGLAELHETGVAHRDITPRNVVLSPEGPKIIDLGVAYTRGATRLTQTGVSMGTPSWMAPEHAHGEDIGPPADVFAWGSLVLFAATTEPPFGERRSQAVLYRIVHDHPDTTVLDPPLREAVDAAMRKDPAERPDALDLAAQVTGSDRDLAATTAVAATMLQRTRLAQTVPTPVSDATRPVVTRPIRSDTSVTEAVDTHEEERSRTSRRAVAILGVVALVGLTAAAVLWGPLGTAETANAPGTPPPIADPTPPAEEPDEADDRGVAAEEGDDPDRPEDEPDAAPRPVLPEAPWADEEHAPSALGEQHAAAWWAEWMPEDCGLYMPAGMEADNNLELFGPTQTRVGDVQFVWNYPDGGSSGLSISVWPIDADHLADYFESEPVATFADGSEIYADDEGPSMNRLIAIPGENCFYEIYAYDMVSLAWGTEGLRRIELP